MTYDDILDDRTEIALCLLETLLVFRDEPLEMMEKHSIENRAFRMTWAVDSRHIREEESRNAPGEHKAGIPGINGGIRRTTALDSSRKRQHPLMLSPEKKIRPST
jgi:hypothetical protein